MLLDDVAEVLPAAAGARREHGARVGSDFPVITPDRWLADFAKLDIVDEVRPSARIDLFGMRSRVVPAEPEFLHVESSGKVIDLNALAASARWWAVSFAAPQRSCSHARRSCARPSS
jgi:hypothetical protein